MLTLEPILDHAMPFALVMARIGGLFLFAPVLASPLIPGQFKALLVFILAAAIYPVVSAKLQVAAPADIFALLPMMFTEALIGATIGLLAMLPLMAMEFAGFLISHQIGFGMALIYNPSADTETDVLGQMLFFTALAGFIGIGGLDAMFGAILSTFDRMPIGGMTAAHLPLDAFTAAIASAYELGIRVAAPVLALVFLQLLAMGFLMKTMPQLNVLSYGFALKILTGLLMLMFCLGVIDHVATDAMRYAMQDILAWAANLAPSPR